MAFWAHSSQTGHAICPIFAMETATMFYYYNYLVYMLAKIWFGQFWQFFVIFRGSRRPKIRFSALFSQTLHSICPIFTIWKLQLCSITILPCACAGKNLVRPILAIFRQFQGVTSSKNQVFGLFLPNASFDLPDFHYGNCNYVLLLYLPIVNVLAKIWFGQFWSFSGGHVVQK